MHFKRLGNSLYKEVLSHPNLKDPVLWASWLVPMIVTPVGRFMSDTQREKSDRLGLSAELFSLYAVGTALYFVFNPIAGLASKAMFKGKGTKFHAVFSGVSGSLITALYSGFGANKVGKFIKSKFLKTVDPAIEHHPKNHRIDTSSGTRAKISPDPVQYSAYQPLNSLRPYNIRFAQFI